MLQQFLPYIFFIYVCRFDAQTGADREVQRILLELLNQMDGFDQTTNVKVSWKCLEYSQGVSELFESVCVMDGFHSLLVS